MNKKKYYFMVMLVSFSLSATFLFSQGSQEKEEGTETEGRIEKEDTSEYPDIKASITVTKTSEDAAELKDLWDQIAPIDQVLLTVKDIPEAGDIVTSVDLEVKDGNVVYTVGFSDSTMLILDAANNDVLYSGEMLDQEEQRDYNGNDENNESEED